MTSLSLDVRGGYANSQREAPDELSFEYLRTKVPPTRSAAFFVNRLNNGQQGSATATFSDLNEDLWSAAPICRTGPIETITPTARLCL